MTTGRTLDDAFLAIVNDWVELTTNAAESAVTMILENSSQYLSDEQQKALTDFHDLYFAEGEMAASKQAMNREVDDLFDAIQAEIAAGGDLKSLNAVEETDAGKRSRLSLSGVQKQLETIIQLETGLKEKLAPVLTNMQFEDAVKQRLTRMTAAWRFSLLSPPSKEQEALDLGEKIGKTLGSKAEREAFYPIVLRRAAPQEAVDDLTFFDVIS